MFMSSDPLHWPDIVSTPSMPRAEAIALEKQGWWRPIVGFLVEPRKERTFGRHQDYHLGYVLALAQQSQGALLFANTTAALLLGHPVWPKPTDISVYKYKGRLKVRALRPHPRATGPVHMRPMTASGPIGVYDLGKGVFVTNREQTAVDVARLEASQTAFIIVCSVLGALATSGDVYQDRLDAGFLKREAEARKRMIAIAEKLPNTAGRQRAMQIISLASGQVESVAEARVLWLIHAYGLPTPIMQYQIFVDGYEFFVDFVWPDQKLIVEFNGEGKYNDDGRPQRAAEERARETLLRSAGYEVVNLSWKQLENPQRVALLIHRFLKKRSSTHIPEPSPRRYLMRTPKPIRAKMAAKEPGSAHRR